MRGAGLPVLAARQIDNRMSDFECAHMSSNHVVCFRFYLRGSHCGRSLLTIRTICLTAALLGQDVFCRMRLTVTKITANRWVCLGACLQDVANLADSNEQVNNEEVGRNGCLCACDRCKKTPMYCRAGQTSCRWQAVSIAHEGSL